MMSNPLQNRRFWPGLICVPIGLLFAIVFVGPGFLLDDAYITLHNARVLTEYGGRDPVYGSSALTGATSLLHLAVMAALGLLLPLMEASRLLTVAGVLVYAAGLWRLTRSFDLSLSRSTLLTIVGLVTGYLPVHLINGLETGWAMAAVVWAIVLADSRWLPLLCGLLPFLRPELALLAGPMMLRQLWLHRGDRAHCAGMVAIALAAAAPFALWAVMATGSLVPNTASAKLAFFGDVSLSLAQRFETLFLALNGSYLLPLCVGLIGLRFMRAGWSLAVFTVLWLLVSLTTVPAALTHNFFRYMAIMAPVAVAGLAALSRRFGRAFDLPLLVIGAWAMATGLVGFGAALDWGFSTRLVAIGRDVQRLTPPHAKILIHDAGYLAWTVPDRQLIDLVGLKTPASERWNRRFIVGEGRRDRALDAIARTSGAQYLVTLTPKVPFWGEIPGILSKEGWGVDRLNAPPSGGYNLYRLTPPTRVPEIRPER